MTVLSRNKSVPVRMADFDGDDAVAYDDRDGLVRVLDLSRGSMPTVRRVLLRAGYERVEPCSGPWPPSRRHRP